MTAGTVRGNHTVGAPPEEEGRMLKRMQRTVAGSAVMTTMFMLAPTNQASASATPVARVARHGSCSGHADWKLKVAPENGRLQLEFEVEHATAADRWRVSVKENGSPLLSSRKVVRADGSFAVKHGATNTSGSDRFVVRATSTSSGEFCVGTVTF